MIHRFFVYFPLRITALLAVLLLLPLFGISQAANKNTKHPLNSASKKNGGINWLSMEEAYQANKVVEKPLFIDVYTSWCGWCVRMDKTTFQDPVVVNYINANFHPVKFNAETHDTISFLEKKFWNSQAAYVKKTLQSFDSAIALLNDSVKLLESDISKADLVNGLRARLQRKTIEKSQMARRGRRTTHDLARDIMNNQMSYPTFVLLFDTLKNNFPIKGYQKPNQLLSFLSFFSEKVYKSTTDLAKYQELFNSSLTAQQGIKLNELPSFKSAIEKAKVSKKKTLVMITNDQLYSSAVMEKGSLFEPEVRAQLNEKFEVAKLNINEKDSITYEGQVFKNVNGIHQLPVAILQNKVQLPALAILDENQKLLQIAPAFFLPFDLVPLLTYFGTDAHKTTAYSEYRRTYEAKRNAPKDKDK